MIFITITMKPGNGLKYKYRKAVLYAFVVIILYYKTIQK